MKVPLPLVGLLNHLTAFMTAWNKVNKKQLGWFDHRKTFVGALLLLAIIYAFYNTINELNQSNDLLSGEVKALTVAKARIVLAIDHQQTLIEELRKTIETQKEYIIELERALLELKAENKDLELEIASLERLLVAATTRQREAEARLEDHLRKLQRVQQLTTDQRESLQRRLNSLQN